ncbi:SDR family oxidoreductase [Salipiger mangrovisoli]|uniref:SDR family oxidoreductase n=1 Tax=Salipiger mangrovisoli TaxID=2865933 RepID=A0ABR9XBI6_9RHOB|nr:SDR family oxidoreductase [Salipiger mangrovisoli]MBE9640790.1 SDR family oxidoreductase [Salipiger mangrovisoli]
MDFGLQGKTALVLGASRGLGAACAQELAREGVRVFAAARDLEAIRAWAAEFGDLVTPVALDMTDAGSVSDLAAQMAAQGIDILVNNSGGPKPGPAMAQTPEAWEEAWAAMAGPIMKLTSALLPGMSERGFGRIITIGSSGIEAPIPNLALSNGVRGALAGWSKTLAAEVAADGITVNMILPGRIATDRVAQLDEAASKRTGKSVGDVQASSRATIPAGRYGKPEEFGAVAAFLASTRASFVTGSMIRVDGGMLRHL